METEAYIWTRGVSINIFRPPWRCAFLTTPSSAGLQLPAGAAYHMAQTDVNTEFYRILAPDGISEYVMLPRVSTQLLLQEEVTVLELSPQLQGLSMGFSWALYFCQKMVESCVKLAGFSSDALLMDHHRVPAMSLDSVSVDGVCAVGCNRQKVLATMCAVKASLNASGLQCSEVEADSSRQILTGLHVHQETGLLSMEASRKCRLRLALGVFENVPSIIVKPKSALCLAVLL